MTAPSKETVSVVAALKINMKISRKCVSIILGLVACNIVISVFLNYEYLASKQKYFIRFSDTINHLPVAQAVQYVPTKLDTSSDNNSIQETNVLSNNAMQYGEHFHLKTSFRKYELHGTAPQIYEEETIIYPPFNITEPNFITDHARDLFFKNKGNIKMMGIPSKEKLIGKMYTVRNGTFQMPYDCGYRSNVSFVLQNRKVNSAEWYHSLAPLIVPDGWAFQCFLDGTVPKIIQALKYLKNPEVKILLKSPRDKIIKEFLTKLNFSEDRIVWHQQSKTVGAHNLLFTCNTPPLHPYLWHRERVLLGSPETLQVPKKEGSIVIITRSGCFNCGRKILNTPELQLALQKKFKKTNVLLFKGPLNYQDTINLFFNASVVIGTHGGGMYNIIFCPKNTTVIEVMPTHEDGRMAKVSDKIIWNQAVLLGQEYWRFPSVPASAKDDVVVDIDLILRIVQRAFGNPKA